LPLRDPPEREPPLRVVPLLLERGDERGALRTLDLFPERRGDDLTAERLRVEVRGADLTELRLPEDRRGADLTELRLPDDRRGADFTELRLRDDGVRYVPLLPRERLVFEGRW
jgi:hypothetical protein